MLNLAVLLQKAVVLCCEAWSQGTCSNVLDGGSEVLIILYAVLSNHYRDCQLEALQAPDIQRCLYFYSASVEGGKNSKGEMCCPHQGIQ